MFPGKISPRMIKQMEKMMKEMGMETEELKALKVTIELEDELLVFEKPKVHVMDMFGSKAYTISGKVKRIKKEEDIKDEEVKLEITEEDIQLVMDQCNVSKEEALKVLEECNGDIAEAILKLSK